MKYKIIKTYSDPVLEKKIRQMNTSKVARAWGLSASYLFGVLDEKFILTHERYLQLKELVKTGDWY